MTADIASLVLEQLRAIRCDIGEMKQRLDRMDLRLSAIEQTLGSLYALSASDRETLQGVIRRVERIERRLELSEG
jgi:uncharacterized membrane protein